MDRYDLITNYRCGSSIEEMERADDGEWMRYEDHVAALAAETARADREAAALAVARSTLEESVALVIGQRDREAAKFTALYQLVARWQAHHTYSISKHGAVVTRDLVARGCLNPHEGALLAYQPETL